MRWFLLFVPLLMMAEPLTKARILELLHKQNPFVLLRSVKMLQSEAKRKQSNSPYDLMFNLVYEKKEYPLSRSLYMEGGAKKLFKRGVEFGVKWRKASGTQEYNNIKTGVDGEYLAHIKLHLNALLQGMGEADIQKEQATLEVLRQKRIFREELNALVFEVLSLYYEAITLQQKEVLVQTRLNRIETMKKLFKQKLDEGVISKQDWLQLKEWALLQRQMLVRLEAKGAKVKRVLSLFLGLNNIELPSRFESILLPPLQKAIAIALQERGSILELAIRAKQLELAHKEAKLQHFGKLEASLIGVHDIQYKKDGVKGIFNFYLPLERSSYKAKKELAAIGNLEVRTKQALLKRTIETKLVNAYRDLEALEKERSILAQRVSLLEQVVDLELQKIEEGVSDFFVFYQKVLHFFRAKEELLENQKEIVLKQLEIEKEMGRIGWD